MICYLQNVTHLKEWILDTWYDARNQKEKRNDTLQSQSQSQIVNDISYMIECKWMLARAWYLSLVLNKWKFQWIISVSMCGFRFPKHIIAYFMYNMGLPTCNIAILKWQINGFKFKIIEQMVYNVYTIVECWMVNTLKTNFPIRIIFKWMKKKKKKEKIQIGPME